MIALFQKTLSSYFGFPLLEEGCRAIWRLRMTLATLPGELQISNQL
jgi:hypothetical protein